MRSDRQFSIQRLLALRSIRSSISELVILDTLQLTFNGNEVVPFSNLGIAWSTDKAVKFKNPSSDPSSCRPSYLTRSCRFSLSLKTSALIFGHPTGRSQRGNSIRPITTTMVTKMRISLFGCARRQCPRSENCIASCLRMVRARSGMVCLKATTP